MDTTHPDPADSADLAEFIEALGQLRVRAGAPSYRTLAKRVGSVLRPPRVVAPTTIADVFRAGRRRLDLDLVVAILRALGLAEAEVEQWRRACLRAHAGPKPGGSAGAARQFPADLATFTGRTAALRQLLDAAMAPAGDGLTPMVVVSAIEGMAGVGKTRLAVHAAHALIQAGHYGEAQLFANMRGFDADQPPVDPATVLAEFLRALGVPTARIPRDRDERAAMFRDRLHGKRALILLDNVADEDQIRDLIPASPSCLVLVTSRRSLLGLDGANFVQLDVFTSGEARALLERIVGGARLQGESAAAAEIGEACGRLPLAVALAGSRLRARPTAQLTDFVDQLRSDKLDALEQSNRSPRLVFDLSYDGLSARLQSVFRLLSLHPGRDFTADSAAALAGTSVLDARSALEDLADENLLQVKPQGRYEMHDLLHAYAAKRAEEDCSDRERDDAVRRVLAWYVTQTDAAAESINPTRYAIPVPDSETLGYTAAFASSAEAIAWFEAELASIQAAVETAAKFGIRYPQWRIPAVTSIYFGTVENWEPSIKLLRPAMDAARAVRDPSALAWISGRLGGAEYRLGMVDEAGEHLETALEIFRGVGDRDGENATMVSLIWFHMEAGQPELGHERGREALVRLRQTGDRNAESKVLNNMAVCLHALNRPEEALECLITALPIIEETNDPYGVAMANRNIGYTTLVLRRFEDAERWLHRAAEVYRANGDHFRHAECLHGIASALDGMGNAQAAEELVRTSAVVFQDLGRDEAARFRARLDASPLRYRPAAREPEVLGAG